MEYKECINFLLTVSQRKVEKDLSVLLASYDVTPVQYGVLNSLWQKNRKNPKEIAEELRLETSTITGVVERMEKKGLVTRAISKEDRRFIDICLTKKGRALEKPVLETVESFNSELLAKLTEEERSCFTATLTKLYCAEKMETKHSVSE
jgi:Transcriptional regulators